jgi:hypothetical protein
MQRHSVVVPFPSMSLAVSLFRWDTFTLNPDSASIRATFSAAATERWRPPVHPNAIVIKGRGSLS